jgi:hypothetical protein
MENVDATENWPTRFADLADLAEFPENRLRIFSLPGLVRSAVDAQIFWYKSDTKASAMRLLANLSEAGGESLVSIFNTENLGNVAIGLTLGGDTPDIRAAALALLSNIADDRALAVQLLEQFPGLAIEIVKGLDLLPHCERRAVFSLVHAFSRSPLALRLLATPEMAGALMTKIRNDETVRGGAIAVLACIMSAEGFEARAFDAPSLQSLVRILRRSIFFAWTQSDLLRVLRALCHIESNRTVLVAAGLIPLLIQALGASIKTGDPLGAEHACSAIQTLIRYVDAELFLRADSSITGLLEGVALLTEPKWDAVRRSARGVSAQIDEDLAMLVPAAVTYDPAPNTPAEIRAWLDAAGLVCLNGAFVLKAIDSDTKLKDLVGKRADELESRLGIGWGESHHLVKAFEGRKWL